MAAKKKRRKWPAPEGLAVEETRKDLEEMHREAEKRMEEIEEAMAKFAPTTEEIREDIEKARSALGEVGEIDMEIKGDECVMLLSQNVKIWIKLDPNTRKILTLLPDDSLWWQNPVGRWGRRP